MNKKKNNKKGFDNEKYVKAQIETIKKRIKLFDNKLYLEFGGKLFDDYHAKRVLPGFELDSKIRLLKELKDDTEMIFCINANDIERKKIRADYGISYDEEVIRLIHIFRNLKIDVNSVVITLYNGQSSVSKFRKRLDSLGVKSYIHTYTKGYPTDVEVIVSEEGYGANPYIETTKPLVVVTAPGPCSGKLATCLSQLYHEYKRGVKAGYAKFETFPVWSLPLKHPVNMAYEAATADLKDKNMIDSFHLEAYGISAVNYNRDLEVFPVLKNILNKITGEDIYKSPTDMGVNSIGECITDDDIVSMAAKKEIIRRYYKALVEVKTDDIDPEVPQRIKLLMNELNISDNLIKAINRAREKEEESSSKVIALEITPNVIITGRETELLTPAASLILNSIKYLTDIPDEIDLLSPGVLKPILDLKKNVLSNKQILNLNDVFNIIRELKPKNIYTLGDLYYNRTLTRILGYLSEYYSKEDINILTMPVDYTFDSICSLYDSFILLSEHNIHVSDACPQNVILNNEGITIVDTDFYYIDTNSNKSAIKKSNIYDLGELFSWIYMNSLKETDFNKRSAMIDKIEKLFMPIGTFVVEPVIKKLAKYKYPIDYLQKR